MGSMLTNSKDESPSTETNRSSASQENPNILQTSKEGKAKALPLQAWTGPEGSRSLRLPDFKQSAHEGGKFVSPTHRPPLHPRKYSWYSFPLEAKSTTGP